MEENFYKDEFEKFLQEQANNHKMFPSDKVWGNIHNKLHGDKNWPGLTVAALAFLAAIIAVSVYFSPKPNIFADKSAPVTNLDKNVSGTPLLSSVRNSGDRKPTNWSFNQKEKVDENTPVSSLPETVVKEKLSTETTVERTKRTNGRRLAVRRASTANEISVEENFEAAGTSRTDVVVEQVTINSAPISENNPAEKESAQTQKSKPVIVKDEHKAAVDEYLKQHPQDVPALTQNRKRALKNTFSYLVYITPSASFRRLREDADFLNQKFANTAGPVDLNYVADVNKIVRHTPGTGVEAGISFRYNITDKLKVATGFQFNVRQYSIEAFKSRTEVATIALQTSTGVDSVTKYSFYRTTNGYASAQLINRYYQLSVPIGLEWEVVGSRNVALNIAASVQPTYIVNRNAYLISTNFKNYAESGGMLRNWNINTSIEAFVNFKSGDFKWQLGPQLRFQNLPTFIKAYPIKEHLMDYGLKIGVSKTIQ